VISRTHGLALSVLLGAASAVGGYALIVTAGLGDAQTKPEVVSGRQIAERARKLDAWEVSLRKTLKARPPALPALNSYAAVTFVVAPGPASLPAPAAVPHHAAQQATTISMPARSAAKTPAKRPGKRIEVITTPIHDDDAPESAVPVAAPRTGTPDPTPAPTPAVVAAVVAPATTPATVPSPPTTLSVEQQCRLLLRAAENKSEQVKQEAERQCEALKNAAERKG